MENNKLQELVKSIELDGPLFQYGSYTVKLDKLLAGLTGGKQPYIPYEECTNLEIQTFLDNKDFVDVSTQITSPIHLDTPALHSQRIASFVNLISSKNELGELCLYVVIDENNDIFLEFDDGHHLLRAYLFLQFKRIDLTVDFIFD